MKKLSVVLVLMCVLTGVYGQTIVAYPPNGEGDVISPSINPIDTYVVQPIINVLYHYWGTIHLSNGTSVTPDKAFDDLYMKFGECFIVEGYEHEGEDIIAWRINPDCLIKQILPIFFDGKKMAFGEEYYVSNDYTIVCNDPVCEVTIVTAPHPTTGEREHMTIQQDFDDLQISTSRDKITMANSNYQLTLPTSQPEVGDIPYVMEQNYSHYTMGWRAIE